jgi:hypothetical protein
VRPFAVKKFDAHAEDHHQGIYVYTSFPCEINEVYISDYITDYCYNLRTLCIDYLYHYINQMYFVVVFKVITQMKPLAQ